MAEADPSQRIRDVSGDTLVALPGLRIGGLIDDGVRCGFASAKDDSNLQAILKSSDLPLEHFNIGCRSLYREWLLPHVGNIILRNERGHTLPPRLALEFY